MTEENYTKLAPVYDHLMRLVRYDKWADYIYELTKDYLNKDAKVLELASGRGNLAQFMSQYYRDITISDKSFYMLKEGKNKKFNKVCCDMTKLPFNNKFDLVISTFDSVNYLTTKKDLLSLFNEVKRILSENGIFAFDISLEKNSYKHIRIPVRKGNCKEGSYIQKTSYDKEHQIHKNIFEIKFNDSKTYKEVHKQKIYPFDVYFQLLEKAKLYVVECYNAFSFIRAKETMERVQFLVRKY